MTAAVEGVSYHCQALQEELDRTFFNAGATADPLSLFPHDDSTLQNLESAKLRILQQGNAERRSAIRRSSKRSKSIPRTTRTLRSHNTGLLTPANSPGSKKKSPASACRTGTKEERSVSVGPTIETSPTRRKRKTTASPYFEKTPTKKVKVSCIPFPPISSSSFGLVQEHLAHDPFRLLIAVIFLNKTRGSVALPVFYELMERYPTPADLAAAKHEDVVDIILHLGLQNQRAKKCINLAKTWTERPPEKCKRYKLLHYPNRGDGKDIKSSEILDESDERIAWEVGQLPGIGAYAIDSWRIFCRDELRGLPYGLPEPPETINVSDKEVELQKEWTRVLPGDKELRAYLRWRWLRNGWVWDPMSGDRRKANEEEMEVARKGGVVVEGEEGGSVVKGGVGAVGHIEVKEADKGVSGAVVEKPRKKAEQKAKTVETDGEGPGGKVVKQADEVGNVMEAEAGTLTEEQAMDVVEADVGKEG